MRAVLVGILVALLAVGWPAVGSAQEEGGEEPQFESHEAEECFEILEGGGEVDDCQEAPSPILPAANELVWGIISFVLLFLLLWRFAWPGLKQAMEGRAERIRASLDEAEQAKAEATSVLDDYKRQLADARGEAGRIIEEARQSADALKRDLQQRAEREAEEQRRRNAEQIAAERDRVMSELQSRVATLAIDLAEKVVETNLDREANLRLIESYINRVGADGARR
jgi:F-type H+-transporting ATPase subunit b